MTSSMPTIPDKKWLKAPKGKNDLEHIHEHLIINGFDTTYTTWIHHGDQFSRSNVNSQSSTLPTNNVEDPCPPLVFMVNDILEHLPNEVNVEDEVNDEAHVEATTFTCNDDGVNQAQTDLEENSTVKPHKFHHDIDDEMLFGVEDNHNSTLQAQDQAAQREDDPSLPQRVTHQLQDQAAQREDDPSLPQRMNTLKAYTGRRCSPPPPESSSDNSCILRYMFGTNVAYGTVHFNTTAPEGFYSVIIDEVIREEACLYVESRTLGDVSAGKVVAWLKIFTIIQ
ncbi:hypothetical protein GIB67_019752 [Kingdonia uniflora]|uniref:Uncharacterized protein n=1 Tax=Kingdonia uniflora TaxID=39325 RepID=A0A7J7MK20_9MAGN|nr:hypothetical protein GIB67_019752 [Kingdonia uniflora]